MIDLNIKVEVGHRDWEQDDAEYRFLDSFAQTSDKPHPVPIILPPQPRNRWYHGVAAPGFQTPQFDEDGLQRTGIIDLLREAEESIAVTGRALLTVEEFREWSEDDFAISVTLWFENDVYATAFALRNLDEIAE